MQRRRTELADRHGLCSFDKEHSLGVMPMLNVDLQALFFIAALLNLVFSLMPLAVFVLPPDESLEQDRNRTGCSPV